MRSDLCVYVCCVSVHACLSMVVWTHFSFTPQFRGHLDLRLELGLGRSLSRVGATCSVVLAKVRMGVCVCVGISKCPAPSPQ